jgi:hypothetical protein
MSLCVSTSSVSDRILKISSGSRFSSRRITAARRLLAWSNLASIGTR